MGTTTTIAEFVEPAAAARTLSLGLVRGTQVLLDKTGLTAASALHLILALVKPVWWHRLQPHVKAWPATCLQGLLASMPLPCTATVGSGREPL